MAELFPFVQFEFPLLLGPADGRYLVRDEPEAEPQAVLILRSVGAPRRRLVAGRRVRPAGDEAQAQPIPTTRVTAVKASAFAGEEEARGWLSRTSSDTDSRAREVADALAVVNRALHTHRAAAADPFVNEVSGRQATVVRLGYGSGDALAEGRWREAVLLPQRPQRLRRMEQLRPQEHLAAVLGGREQVLASETLLLRARLDLDAGRMREAALQIRVGLEALLSELEGQASKPGQAEDFAFLDNARKSIGEAANAALRGELDEATGAAVQETIERCERVLRRKRVLSG